jgi:hypothetical protein
VRSDSQPAARVARGLFAALGNMKIIRICVVALLILSVQAFGADEQKHNFKPTVGYVPDSETAIRIAVAIWEPIYGRKQIEGQKPYRATLKDGVWTVEGSLPDGWLGGVAVAEISKSDGRILRVSHGK